MLPLVPVDILCTYLSVLLLIGVQVVRCEISGQTLLGLLQDALGSIEGPVDVEVRNQPLLPE